jgi:hypothetical protein
VAKKAYDTIGQLLNPKIKLPTADRRLRIPSHHIHNLQEQGPSLGGPRNR